MRLIVTGGGTGGHVYPALAIAEAMKEIVEPTEILYIGTGYGIESDIVPKQGYRFETIEVKGFIRRLTFENVRRLKMALSSMKECRRIMKEFRPDIVVGTGGYVCGPVLKAAHRYGAFTAIHEQNAYPGVTNKLLAKEADVIFLGFEKAKERLKGTCPKIFVGNPVRRSIFSMDRKRARQALGLDETRKMILSIGGSGGSDSLNKLFLRMLPLLLKKDIAFLHTTGKYHYETFMDSIKDVTLGKNQEFKNFEDDIPLYMAATDLVICSAGATTLAEVTAMGRASIVIPKAYTAENHQEYNARVIKENEAGDYILEKDLEKETSIERIMEVLEKDELRRDMEKNSKAMYPTDPAKEAAQMIWDLYNAKHGKEAGAKKRSK